MTHTSGLQHRNYLRIAAWALAAALLLLPFGAMQVTDEVNWGVGDFAAAALLLAGAGLALEAVLRFARTSRTRIVLGLAIAAALVLIWAELAVGLFH